MKSRDFCFDVIHWMNSQAAACFSGLLWALMHKEKPPSAGFRPAGPAGSTATARHGEIFDVFESASHLYQPLHSVIIATRPSPSACTTGSCSQSTTSGGM